MIVISVFKIDMPPILGGLGEGKESTTPLTSIRTPELWNAKDGVRGVYLRVSKSLKDHRMKINASFNRYLGLHMEARLLANELLGKCSVFWSQLPAEI